jgi:casein kinase II subunit alpha
MQDDYEIYTKIGSGRYSEVFKGYDIMKHKNVILKVLKPNSLKKLQREVLVLRNIKQHP